MRERVDLKSPVQEYCPPGSVRGARGNPRPHLDLAGQAPGRQGSVFLGCKLLVVKARALVA
jgi:hypothetical protein